MSKHKLELEVVLPRDAATCDACVSRLLGALAAAPGIVEAHIDREDANHPRLCVHYEPDKIGLEEIGALAATTGSGLASRYEHLWLPTSGLRHERQARLAEGVFARQPGVLRASIAFGAGRLFVEFDPTKTNRDVLLSNASKAGIEARVDCSSAEIGGELRHEHEHNHGGPLGDRAELAFSLACGACTGVAWGLERSGADPRISLLLFVLAYVLGSWFTVQEVVVALRARRFEIDFLMLVAAVGAAVLGEWFEGALLLFLFTLGHSLEAYAMRRARNAIDALSKLTPETACLLDEAGAQTDVPVAQLVVGDRVLVKPNTRVPADGFVSEGMSSVNQAPITGESVPVDKRPVDDLAKALSDPDALGADFRVFAGTINGSGALTVVVTKHASQSTLARVVQLVAEAETQKSPTQRFTERFERAFVPIILAFVVVLFVGGLVGGESFAASFYRAMAVLVAASPCALAIATPSAVLSGVARAARAGVLVKGGAHLESLGTVRAIAFDKTGTLTEGKPTLVDVVPVEGVNVQELLRIAVAIERGSDHPLAAAIVAGGTKRLGPLDRFLEATNVESIVGYGVRGAVGASVVRIGKLGLFKGADAPTSEVRRIVELLQSEGRTVMVVRADDRFMGALGVMDTPRASAKQVISELGALGIDQTIMLTGDNQSVADAVAEHVGISVALGDLLPEQKVAAVADLAKSDRRVAMVGDGVNDAPAMANATVGIAMGAGGSDVALETADIALMADDLSALPFAVALSRAAHRIIRQNLWISLGMVAFLIPATVLGVAKIGVAVALHEGSTLLVVANALRLLAFSDRRVNH